MISYQRQSCSDLVSWQDEDAPIAVSVPNAPWETPVIVNVPLPAAGQRKFFRFEAIY